MTDLQKKIVEIMEKVHNICVENNIQYTLSGGSMIGAIREKGIIPWDDDIDIFMTYENYYRFIDIVKEYKDDTLEFKIPLISKNYLYTFIKAVDKNTSLIEYMYKDSPKYILGVYVDIFPVVGISSPDDLDKINKRQKFLFNLRWTKTMKSDFTLKKALIKPIVSLIPMKSIIKAYLKDHKPTEGYKYVHDPNGYSPNKVVPKEWFDEYILMPFEDKKFFVIKEYDKYLTQVFGNYMERPPKEKQVSNHDFAYLNLNKPYREYVDENIGKKKRKNN